VPAFEVVLNLCPDRLINTGRVTATSFLQGVLVGSVGVIGCHPSQLTSNRCAVDATLLSDVGDWQFSPMQRINLVS
jgi:hypothetical protein